MRSGKKFYAVTAAALTAAALAVGVTGAASASSRTPSSGGATNNCADGIYAGYCGTQESATGLFIAVGWGGQIIGTRYPQARDAEFFWFADGSSSASDHDKYAEFAPGGVASNKVMAEVRHRIVLTTASGAADQKWVFDGTGWTNVQTGDVLKATGNGGPILAAHGPSSGGSESWSFVTP